MTISPQSHHISYGLFTIKRGVQGHYYLPKQIQSVVGNVGLVHSMGIAVAIWNKDAKIEDVVESIEIILQDLKLRMKLEED